jgi:RNA polymerase sigma factor for flagellar operon FliA
MPKLRKLAAKIFAYGALDQEDLVQAAAQALLRARKLFDPTKSKWSTYAMNRARFAMVDAIRELDHVPRLERARAKKDGRFVGAVLSSDREGIQVAEQGYERRSVASAASVAGDGDFWTSLPKRIGARLAEVLRLYYVEDLNLKEVGLRLGLSESRVCQLHAKAVQRLRWITPKESSR